MRYNAFRLLKVQTQYRIPDDAKIWGSIFDSYFQKIPLFPYRIQAIALWGEATNWRVLQASAYQDIWNSLEAFENSRWGMDENDLGNAPHGVNIFDHCAEWSKQRGAEPGSLGIVLETVRSFLAEWIAESEWEPVREPEVPKDCFEFTLGETSVDYHPTFDNFIEFGQH